ncbi:MAG: HAMP domain-containing histidine kinase [Gammaproteobacteria bacterium]|nr:HAMP domain-containing histidine kinase [Gammaproteobacteria bacterium]NNF49486.1 HAMP domain-containing histidine kinase [Woeseiaceae bacterium]MBT8094249.1 HAMP domain-containing histidine kinase [Gammaproteobacteria bacterium]MBT8105305.1 HAMP domain-containing histidine kinase [Gammaproteobacteria bacterium]NNK25319.1 HAMP domain-containing histidine kinase [Woeseiaceae bacterium]
MNSARTDALEKQTGRGSRDALLHKALDETELGLRMLVTLNAFRLLISTSLLLLFVVGTEPRFFGDTKPTLFAAVAASYLVFAILSAVSLRQDYVPRKVLATTQLFADIVAITLLMHASGGISSGLGGLLIIFIGAGSLVLPVSAATTLAAIATLAILGEQAYAQVTSLMVQSNWPAAGVLGAIIFAIALAAQPLAGRIRASEALARQFGVDLKNLSELNDYIVQHLRESIVVVDDADTVRLINGSATQLLAAGPIQRGTELGTVCTPLADYIGEWRLDHDMPSHPEMTLITEGDNVRITAHLAPLGKAGRRDGPILVFLEDVSHINARVQQSKLASLGRLSASIAHEIRNPVGAMSHAAQLLAESPGLSNDDQRLTEIIESHSERVSHIIDNVLQLSRRDSSRPERLQLAAWLEDFAAEFVRTLELQEGELTIGDVPADLEARMDRGHLRQVLWNLCDNAVKYASETGGIMVEVQGGRMPGQGRPYIEVLDCGHGVDDATADKIFEPFYTARSGGTGLGLYISRELCELNRATLLYLDRPGGGSIFRIVFSDPDRWDTQDEQ